MIGNGDDRHRALIDVEVRRSPNSQGTSHSQTPYMRNGAKPRIPPRNDPGLSIVAMAMTHEMKNKAEVAKFRSEKSNRTMPRFVDAMI